MSHLTVSQQASVMIRLARQRLPVQISGGATAFVTYKYLS
uniref:Uncharacterized protein n=1 Tax=Anguilla anguilla TaxID=7936 RepID=A0A0E9QAE8_ANGAN